jgi:hypothetical protein
MAILNRGIIGEVSGRLGGSEFASYKGRTIIKQRKQRQSTTSPARMIAQNGQAKAISHWHGLTDAQRLAWNTCAQSHPVTNRFGVPQYLNGFQLFLTMPHDFRFYIVEEWYDVPPTKRLPEWSPGAISVIAPNYISCASSMTYPPSEYNAYAYISRFRPNQTRKPYRWQKVGFAGSVPFNNPLVFDYALAALHVDLIVGEFIALKVEIWAPLYWPVFYDLGIIEVTAS